MVRHKMLLVALAILATSTAAMAQQPTDVQKLFNWTIQSVARLDFTYENELTGESKRNGQAFCIDEAKGLFITLDLPNSIPPSEIKDFTLTPPGQDAAPVKAEFIGIDPDQGVGFLQVTEKHNFKAMKLDMAPKIEIGTPVYSVGLLGPQMGNAAYLGSAEISGLFRVPTQMCMVTGGDLTVVSSPVMTADGRMIGIVGQQLMLEYRIRFADGQQADVGLTGNQNARFFVPMTELATLLSNPPTKGNIRKLAWLGIFQVKAPTATEADVMGLGTKGAVIVGQMLPADKGGAAEKAGIKQGDAITAINGKPIEKLPSAELTEANFIRQVWLQKPGDKATLTVFRDKKEREVAVPLEPMPPQLNEAARYYNRILGLAARDILLMDRYSPGRVGPLETPGVFLVFVVPDGPAGKAKLHAGDLITQLNDKPVANVGELGNLITAAGKGETLKFQVMRNDKPEIVTVKP